MDWVKDDYGHHRPLKVTILGVECEAHEWITDYKWIPNAERKHCISIMIPNKVARLGFQTPEFFKERDARMAADWHVIVGPYNAWFDPQPWSGYQI